MEARVDERENRSPDQHRQSDTVRHAPDRGELALHVLGDGVLLRPVVVGASVVAAVNHVFETLVALLVIVGRTPRGHYVSTASRAAGAVDMPSSRPRPYAALMNVHTSFSPHSEIS